MAQVLIGQRELRRVNSTNGEGFVPQPPSRRECDGLPPHADIRRHKRAVASRISKPSEPVERRKVQTLVNWTPGEGFVPQPPDRPTVYRTTPLVLHRTMRQGADKSVILKELPPEAKAGETEPKEVYLPGKECPACKKRKLFQTGKRVTCRECKFSGASGIVGS